MSRAPDAVALGELLSLEKLEDDLYRGSFVADEPRRLYGGQVAAQALRAAGATVPAGRLPHSLHGYFLRAGDAAMPTVFQVHRDRDGRSFSARRVVAIQRGEVIFSMAASFQDESDGPDEHVPTTAAALPLDSSRPWANRVRGVELRAAAEVDTGTGPDVFWVRVSDPLGEDPLLHSCALTYASDLSTGLAPYASTGGRPGASIDHAVWFHRPARLDDWLLVRLAPHNASGGRGFYTGAVHDKAGRLVASLTQEMLFRIPRAARS